MGNLCVYFYFIYFFVSLFCVQDKRNQDTFPEKTVSRKANIHRDENLEKLEARLAGARALIKEAMKIQNHTKTLEDEDYVPHGEIYRNPYAFHRYSNLYISKQSNLHLLFLINFSLIYYTYPYAQTSKYMLIFVYISHQIIKFSLATN